MNSAVARVAGGALVRRAVWNAPAIRRWRRSIRSIRRYTPYARPALRVGRAVYKTARSRNRKRKRQTMNRVGDRVGTSTAKKAATQVGTIISTKQLYQLQLLNLTKMNPAGDTAITTQRRLDVVNFRGIKFCIHFRNLLSSTPLHVHVAVVSPKAADGSLATLPLDEFFRSNGETNDRSVTFSTALSGMDMRCLPINTDKYLVHKHKRMIVAPNTSTEGRASRYMEWYMKVHRQIRYKNDTDDPEGKNMYLLVWCTNAEETGGAAGIGTALKYDVRLVKYFRNPCCA